MFKIRTILRFVVPALLLGGLASPAEAAIPTVCTISPSTLNFGAYNRTSGTALDAASSVTISCTNNPAFTISFGAGGSGNQLARRMASGANLLNYNLYKNGGYTVILGNGASGTQQISGTVTAGVSTPPIFFNARIPALQNVANGTYVDTVVMTITY